MNFLLAAHTADPLVGDESGISHVYDDHIKGYAGRFTDSVVEQIRRMPEVAYVEKDQIVKTQEIQKSAPWVSLVLLIRLVCHMLTPDLSPGYFRVSPASAIAQG